MRNKNRSVEDARLKKQDKEVAKNFRAIKVYNHEFAKQGERYDRNIKLVIEYHGVVFASLSRVLKVNQKRETEVLADVILEPTTDKLTKQFREIAYIIRKVREYNEIAKNSDLDHVLLVRYDGDTLELIKRYWNDPFYHINGEEIETDTTILFLDIMSLKYATATKELSKVAHKIKVMATKL